MTRCYCVVLLWSLNSHLETGEKVFTIHPFVFVTLFFHLMSFFHVFSLHSTINFEQTCWFIALHDFDEQSKYFREAMHFNYYFFFLHIFFLTNTYNYPSLIIQHHWVEKDATNSEKYEKRDCVVIFLGLIVFFNSGDSKLTTIWSTILFHPFLYQYMKYKKAFNVFIYVKRKRKQVEIF